MIEQNNNQVSRSTGSELFKIIRERDKRSTAELRKIVDETKKKVEQYVETRIWMQETVTAFEGVLKERWHYEQTL